MPGLSVMVSAAGYLLSVLTVHSGGLPCYLLVFVMADIVTATLVGRGDVWANVRNAKEEMEICARVLATMMVLTAYQTKLRSAWSSCDEEIRQHPEKAWPLISPRQIRGLDLG